MKPNPDIFPFPLVALDETDSTNRYLGNLCDARPDAVPEFTTVSAEYQTAGKGQRGNSWEAELGKNLLFSLLLRPLFLEARHQFVLSQLVSLALKEELESLLLTQEVSIKWPNDIYWRDRKVCGILIENDLTGAYIGRCICGIGLNVNQETFRSDAPNPVSLKQVTGREHDRHGLLAAVVGRIACYYEGLRSDESGAWEGEIASRYAHSLFRRQGFHPYEDASGRFLARLLRVDPDGRFVLEDEGGRERGYLFKEVQYIV